MADAWKNQERTKRGRFDRLNPCEGCGKSAGEDYYSDPRCNEIGLAVCLCSMCATRAETMSTNALVSWMRLRRAQRRTGGQ